MTSRCKSHLLHPFLSFPLFLGTVGAATMPSGPVAPLVLGSVMAHPGPSTEAATQDFLGGGGESMTWTFDVPRLLDPKPEFGVDVGMNSSTSAEETEISSIDRLEDEYSGRARYLSGEEGRGVCDSTMNKVSGDFILPLDLEHPLSPSPESGAIVLAGDVELSWSNLPAKTGTDIWVDVWFGADPGALSKVVSKGFNTTTHTVAVPGEGT